MLRFSVLATFCFAITCGKLLFDGSASRGPKAVWKHLNIQGSRSSITVVNDPKYGKVWKFFKARGDRRAEGHGAKGFQAQEGGEYYIAWLLKLDHPVNLNTWANFQWKAYGKNMKQNYPFIFKALNGKLTLQYKETKLEDIWATPLRVNRWLSLVLRVHVSRDRKRGFIEFWYNGKKQTLKGGSQRFYGRTLDAEYCDPKWGAYGGIESDVTAYVSSIKIADNYREAAPKL